MTPENIDSSEKISFELNRILSPNEKQYVADLSINLKKLIEWTHDFLLPAHKKLLAAETVLKKAERMSMAGQSDRTFPDKDFSAEKNKYEIAQKEYASIWENYIFFNPPVPDSATKALDMITPSGKQVSQFIERLNDRAHVTAAYNFDPLDFLSQLKNTYSLVNSIHSRIK